MNEEQERLAPVISIARDHGLPEWLVRDLTTFIEVFLLVGLLVGFAMGIVFSRLVEAIAR